MNGILAIGTMFVFAGLMGLAIPTATTQKTQTLAKVGELKLQSSGDMPQPVPKFLSGGLLAAGLILFGTGLYQKR